MNTLMLTGVSDDLQRLLAQRAAANRRSVEEEALCCLQIAIAQDEAVLSSMPEARWQELLARLVTRTERKLLVVGGEAEQGRVERLCAPLPGTRVEAAHALPLVQLAGRLAGCAGFIGHDSGITHLAAALGVPALVLWGETSEEVWRPLGARVRILPGGAGLTGIGVEQLLAEWEAFR